MHSSRWNYLVVVTVVLGIILLGGCARQTSPAPAQPPVSTPTDKLAPAWMDIELTDVATGQTFKISDYKGKPILIESFAVWCPTCLAQQKEVNKARQSEGEGVIHISLDTDPNEDEAKVREHIERNGFDWYYVVSPVEFTKALIDEFGLKIVSAPRAPVVLICEDQSTRFLRSGLKSADELLSEVERGCQ